MKVRAALEEQGSRQTSPTMWQCPADGHDDHKASLSIGQGRLGALVFCQAGCDLSTAILPALKLTPPDLFDGSRESNGYERRRVVAEYPYLDEAATMLFLKVRYVPKSFNVKRPDGMGGWEWGLAPGTRRVLYHLPRLVAAPLDALTWLVEGEKDVHVLETRGQVATCNFDGAGNAGERPKWRAEYSPFMVGRRVRIVADRDEQGRAHAEYIEICLRGIARSVEIVEAAQGKDSADHLGAGLGLDEFVRWTR